jgi:hypothetical protein
METSKQQNQESRTEKLKRLLQLLSENIDLLKLQRERWKKEQEYTRQQIEVLQTRLEELEIIKEKKE